MRRGSEEAHPALHPSHAERGEGGPRDSVVGGVAYFGATSQTMSALAETDCWPGITGTDAALAAMS